MVSGDIGHLWSEKICCPSKGMTFLKKESCFGEMLKESYHGL